MYFLLLNDGLNAMATAMYFLFHTVLPSS